jgi:hypothetical protein
MGPPPTLITLLILSDKKFMYSFATLVPSHESGVEDEKIISILW